MTNQLLDAFWPGLAHAPELPSQTFFFEVVPSAQIQIPPRDRYGYAERERLAARICTVTPPPAASGCGRGRLDSLRACGPSVAAD